MVKNSISLTLDWLQRSCFLAADKITSSEPTDLCMGTYEAIHIQGANISMGAFVGTNIECRKCNRI